MNSTKAMFTSTTVWGVLITTLSAILMIAGVKIPGLDDPALPMELAALAGALLSLYGRIRATSVIAGLFKAE